MLYEPLNENQNEIRVLRFLSRRDTSCEKTALELRIEKVSLDDVDEHYRDFGINKTNGIWKDVFTSMVDLRSSIMPESSRNIPRQARFAWGEFEALSYVWGEATPSYQISLNGYVKEISSNLMVALQALYSLPETRFGMYYWIDALCINQEDITERNHQVKRMKEIYSKARAVIAWLGQEVGEDDRAIRVMKNTYRDPSQNGRLIPPPDFDSNDWDALCNFMRKPYWSRLWIIQELAVNQNATLFLCGSQKLTRETVRMGASCCQILLRENRVFTHKVGLDAWDISTRAYRLVDMKLDITPDAVLKKTLNLARQAAATDERDKIYGILGLLPESISSKIIPDYSQSISVQQVFMEMTKAIIQATGTLEQIIYGAKSVPPTWPSWVPDLRLPFPRQHVRHLRESRSSQNSRAEFSFLDGPGTENILACKGFKVDIVDGIMASLTSHSSPVYPRYISNRYDDGIDRAVMRTLIMDHPKTRKFPALKKIPWPVESYSNTTEPIRQQSSSWTDILNTKGYQEFHKFREANKDFCVGGLPFQALFSPLRRKVRKTHVISYHLRLTLVSLKGRRLITTETGYVCLVPDSVQRGDTIAILLGCNFPVLLRPWQNRFRVLGECYVHGLMDGDIFRLEKEERLSREKILIC
jgi:hypothetical protein